MKKCFVKGFTLAEVLITLAIIGIIAAITVPNLLAKYTEHVTVSKVKEANSILHQAFNTAVRENGDFSEYIVNQLANGVSRENAAVEFFSTGLKIEKDCAIDKRNCRPTRWASCSDKTWLDYRSGSDRCIMLKNGMLLCFNDLDRTADCVRSNSSFNTHCASLHVDINGISGPNQYSRDDFWWIIKKGNTLEPMMGYGNTYVGCSGGRGGDDASRNGAAKWILLKGNMDYLHKTVGWE